MAKILIFVFLCAVTVLIAQESQVTSRRRIPVRPSGGSLVWLGGAHAMHGGSHATQGGNQTSQYQPQENQIRIRRDAQSGPHVDQGGDHSSQGQPHENQGRVRRQVQSGGPHYDQGGPRVDQSGSHSSQDGPHVNQGRNRREADNIANDDSDIFIEKAWVTCDPTVLPRITCHDCSTRMICKDIGGLLKTCSNSHKPYCNRGVCSATPSNECMKY